MDISKPKKVFVVDDEEEIVSILTEILNSDGFEAKGFTNPRTALETLESESPELLLFDYKMPIVDGVEALRIVRTKLPNIPVIFISGYLNKEALLEAIKYGIFGVIEKPFKDEDVVDICKSAVAAFRQVSQLEDQMKSLAEVIA